jgi:hypothetical protein
LGVEQLSRDSFVEASPGVSRAYNIEPVARRRGITTDMVAMTDGQMFAQLWVAADDKLLHSSARSNWTTRRRYASKPRMPPAPAGPCRASQGAGAPPAKFC